MQIASESRSMSYEGVATENVIVGMASEKMKCTCTSKKLGNRGSTVVKALCYKSEGRWFDSRWCHWNFSLT